MPATLVRFGAPSRILLDGSLGTDNLVRLLQGFEGLIALGGEYRWSSRVERLIRAGGDGRVVGVGLAEGRRSAGRRWCWRRGTRRASCTPSWWRRARRSRKIFAVGFRVEHPQGVSINAAQYGDELAKNTDTTGRGYGLPAANCRMALGTADAEKGERGCYSFCMCPGGQVVPTSLERTALHQRHVVLKPGVAVGQFGRRRDVGAVRRPRSRGRPPRLRRRRRPARRPPLSGGDGGTRGGDGGGGLECPCSASPTFSKASCRRSRCRARRTASASSRRRCTSSTAGGHRGARGPPPLGAHHAGVRVGGRVTTRRRNAHVGAGAGAARARPSRRSSSRPLPRGEGAGYAGGIVSAAVDGLRVGGRSPRLSALRRMARVRGRRVGF